MSSSAATARAIIQATQLTALSASASLASLHRRQQHQQSVRLLLHLHLCLLLLPILHLLPLVVLGRQSNLQEEGRQKGRMESPSPSPKLYQQSLSPPLPLSLYSQLSLPLVLSLLIQCAELAVTPVSLPARKQLLIAGSGLRKSRWRWMTWREILLPFIATHFPMATTMLLTFYEKRSKEQAHT